MASEGEERVNLLASKLGGQLASQLSSTGVSLEQLAERVGLTIEQVRAVSDGDAHQPIAVWLATMGSKQQQFAPFMSAWANMTKEHHPEAFASFGVSDEDADRVIAGDTQAPYNVWLALWVMHMNLDKAVAQGVSQDLLDVMGQMKEEMRERLERLGATPLVR